MKRNRNGMDKRSIKRGRGGGGGGDREMQGNGVHKLTEARQKNELMGIQV